MDGPDWTTAQATRPAHSACRREIRQHGKSGRRSRHFAALCVQGDHREAISETVVGNRWLMSALRAHQIHYGNERTAWIVDTYVVDCHVLTVAKPEVRELRTEGPVLIDCRRAVGGSIDIVAGVFQAVPPLCVSRG